MCRPELPWRWRAPVQPWPAPGWWLAFPPPPPHRASDRRKMDRPTQTLHRPRAVPTTPIATRFLPRVWPLRRPPATCTASRWTSNRRWTTNWDSVQASWCDCCTSTTTDGYVFAHFMRLERENLLTLTTTQALCIRMDRSQQGVCPRTCLSARPVKPRARPPGVGPGPRGPPPMGPPQGRPMSPAGGRMPMSPSAGGQPSRFYPPDRRPMSPSGRAAGPPPVGQPMPPVQFPSVPRSMSP